MQKNQKDKPAEQMVGVYCGKELVIKGPVPVELMERLKALAKRTGRTLNQCVCDALDSYIASRRFTVTLSDETARHLATLVADYGVSPEKAIAAAAATVIRDALDDSVVCESLVEESMPDPASNRVAA